ncbi:MAG: outer membrane beta-barrel protein [Bacteroidaceae bacterium]|nr:outer membrane beta-barrel protein [Bacteroidaceae bacterium]
MKKMILMAAMAVATMTANAQVWMGGKLCYDYDKNGGTTTNTIAVAPEIGYTLSDKWDIAVGLNYGVSFGDVTTVNRFSINPYARYTFAKADMVSFFVDGGVKVGAVKRSGSDATTTWGVGLRPGLALHISDKVSLVSHLGYLGYQHSSNHDQFGLGVDDTAIDFGMYFSF